MQSKIIGIGSYLPSRKVTNFDLAKFLETSDEWIQKRTGIVERRWVENQSTTDLALFACEDAIKMAGIKKEEIDLIIFATLSPDHEFPGSGCFLQAKLGLSELAIPAFDIRQQCSGFIYGLNLADSFIKSGQYKNILLVGAEVHSSGLDQTNRGRDVTVLFGDGAGAALLTRCEVNDSKKDSHIYSTEIHADGRFAKELWVPSPGTAYPIRITKEHVEEGLVHASMNGKVVFKHAVVKMQEVLISILKKNNLNIDDIDLFLFHQANLRINEHVANELKIPSNKVFNTIQKYGNTTAGTIPIGMVDAYKEGKLKKGDLVAVVAFGSGFTWGASIFRF
ncbi:MAG: beta-ketoacyl-ACP synthase III [Bacteriovoracaceae bacterium]